MKIRGIWLYIRIWDRSCGMTLIRLQVEKMSKKSSRIHRSYLPSILFAGGFSGGMNQKSGFVVVWKIVLEESLKHEMNIFSSIGKDFLFYVDLLFQWLTKKVTLVKRREPQKNQNHIHYLLIFCNSHPLQISGKFILAARAGELNSCSQIPTFYRLFFFFGENPWCKPLG